MKVFFVDEHLLSIVTRRQQAKHCPQIEGGDLSPLTSTGEATSEVPCPVLGESFSDPSIPTLYYI